MEDFFFLRLPLEALIIKYVILERDLIGLSGSHVCLLKAEADVEDEINIPARVLKQAQRFTVHTNLQVEIFIYIVHCILYIINIRNMGTKTLRNQEGRGGKYN